ncbi:substrate-binding periplasmic protein [Pseudobacteriovorax antillogorgiicola]|uniref:Amino acid ABC transporter substrate-binding protein, PAAT family n=1 Tax=Pseudobacteriovorax antillogorgiicola TaxID=1513793 RepID=A0A1Y6BL82_9BACT|nr:transporter substrate-binding domain-containing protein [Pseudobacteriovorax antillogorgiicola]TCS54620.1 amino acid ABC transporter substrate-binding protein (PAAT family) [Pseudobacteriovorax antillogorgiicola]SMF17390.1 amino acid ABC transporter substrate-binding protein, PAAT family [Pseudobacteriovorax antillogorgiicola]
MKLFVLYLLVLMPQLAQSKELKLVFGLSLPPYVISENETGIEMDIIREVLEMDGHTLKPIFTTFEKVPILARKKGFAGAATVTKDLAKKNLFITDSHIKYQNFAITLKSSKTTINGLNDLAGKKIVAFQNADKYLGNEFKEAVGKAAKYEEVRFQEVQNRGLFNKTFDVVIGDINIFKYYNQKIKDVDTSPEVTYHAIFEPSHYHMAFQNKEIAEQFNKGLAKLKSDGRYQKIIDKYVKSDSML